MPRIRFDMGNASYVSKKLLDKARKIGNTEPLMADIAQEFYTSTVERYDTGRAPSGRFWAANEGATIKWKGHDTVLIGKTRRLRDGFRIRHGKTFAELRNDVPYGKYHQGGSTVKAWGRARMSPWRNVPERPFMAITGRNRTNIARLFREFIRRAI